MDTAITSYLTALGRSPEDVGRAHCREAFVLEHMRDERHRAKPTDAEIALAHRLLRKEDADVLLFLLEAIRYRPDFDGRWREKMGQGWAVRSARLWAAGKPPRRRGLWGGLIH